MKKTLLLTLLLASACTSPDLTESSQALTSPGSCAVLSAIPDDGLDDRQAIQDALTSQGCAELSSGTYDVVTPAPRLSGANRYDMIVLAGGRSLRGAGPATVLKFSGDAGHGDWRGVGMTGEANVVADLLLDTTALENTEEQTHAIQITGPALNQRVSGNWFRHPSLGASAGGDCIKVVGYDPSETTPDKRVSMIVNANVFAQCDRSGVAIHSGLSEATISANLFLATGDQDIDLEGGGGAIDNLTVAGNVFRRALNNGVSVAFGADLTKKATLSGNSFSGGRFYAYNVEQLTVSGNSFELPGRAIELIKMSKHVVISGNSFTISQGTNTAAVITASHHNSGKPGAIAVTGNVFGSSSSTGTNLNLISASDVVVTGNVFAWTQTSPTTSVALNIYGITQPTESILVSSNVFRGAWTRALQVSNAYEVSHGGGIRSVTFSSNVLRGPTFGLACFGGPGPFVSVGNSGAPNSCAAATSGN